MYIKHASKANNNCSGLPGSIAHIAPVKTHFCSWRLRKGEKKQSCLVVSRLIGGHDNKQRTNKGQTKGQAKGQTKGEIQKHSPNLPVRPIYFVRSIPVNTQDVNKGTKVTQKKIKIRMTHQMQDTIKIPNMSYRSPNFCSTAAVCKRCRLQYSTTKVNNGTPIKYTNTAINAIVA